MARPTTLRRLRFEDLELDEDSHEVRRAGRVIETSPTEFKLLRYLMLNPNRVLSKAQILDHVWDYDFRGESGIVESYISYLRRKIDTEGLPPLIHTKRGVGYVLRLPPAGLMSPTPRRQRPRPVPRVVRQLEAVPLRTRLVAIVVTPARRGADPHQPRDGLPDAAPTCMAGVDAELQPVARPGREPGPGRPAARRRPGLAVQLRLRRLPSQFGDVTGPPHRRHRPTPDLPPLAVTDPRVTSGEPFTVALRRRRREVALRRRAG